MLSPQETACTALPKLACRPNAWLRSSAVMLTACLGTWAAAQSLSPAELAAKSGATTPMRTLSQPVATAGQTAKTNQTKEHEAQLSAIRQAILDATLDRPTRVISSAWVDDKGALHEASHFHSEAKVRGYACCLMCRAMNPRPKSAPKSCLGG